MTLACHTPDRDTTAQLLHAHLIAYRCSSILIGLTPTPPLVQGIDASLLLTFSQDDLTSAAVGDSMDVAEGLPSLSGAVEMGAVTGGQGGGAVHAEGTKLTL